MTATARWILHSAGLLQVNRCLRASWYEQSQFPRGHEAPSRHLAREIARCRHVERLLAGPGAAPRQRVRGSYRGVPAELHVLPEASANPEQGPGSSDCGWRAAVTWRGGLGWAPVTLAPLGPG